MSRLLCCVFCLLASPAAAELITISEGYYPQVNINNNRELIQTGGTIGYLNAVGGVSTIHGGAIESSRITNGATVVLDGTSMHGKSSTLSLHAEQGATGGSTIYVHGYHFRMYSYGQGDHYSRHQVEAYLLDGTFAYVALVRHGDMSLHHFELVKHDPVFLDPTRDWDFTLEDLNLIRNSFGESNSDIDTNFDGLINLADLNLVRNHFGDDFYYTPDMEFSGVIPPYSPSAVPEPSSFALTVLALCALAGTPSRRRCLR